MKKTQKKKRTLITRFGYAAIIAIAAFALYANTLGHAYVLDDFATITGNSLVRGGIRSVPQIMTTGYWYGMDGRNAEIYRPLSLVLFATEWQISPGNPALGHAVNVILYLLTCVFLFYFLKRLLSSYHEVIPFLITLLWLAHPIHTEVVANIKSGDEILSFLFSMMTLNQVLLYHARGKLPDLILLPVFFILALLSKENAVCLLLLVPISAYFFTAFNKKKFLWICISLGLMFIMYLVIRFFVLDQSMMKNLSINDNVISGAKNFSERIGTTFILLGYYVYKLFVPVSFSSDYSFNQVPLRGVGNILSIISILIYVFLIVFSILRFKKKDVMSYGILFYLFSMIAVSNVFMLIGSTMAERFLFFPSLGFAVVVVLFLFKLFGLNVDAQHERNVSLVKLPKFRVLIALFLCIIVFYSIKTTERNVQWKSNLALFSADVNAVPNSSTIKFEYAQEVVKLIQSGEIPANRAADYLANAEKHLQKAMIIDTGNSLVCNVLGQIYNIEMKFDDAIVAFKRAIALAPINFYAFLNMGNSYYKLKQYDSAIIYIRRSIELNPNSYNAYNSLAGCYYSKGDYAEALKLYLKSASLNGRNADTYKNLGAAYASLQKYDDAIASFRKALELQPGSHEIISSIETVEKLKEQSH